MNDQVRGMRSIAGDALITIQGWYSFDIASCATLYRSAWIPCFAIETRTHRFRYSRLSPRKWWTCFHQSYLRMHVALSVRPVIYLCSTQQCIPLPLIQNFSTESSNRIWFAYIFRLSEFSPVRMRPTRLDDDYDNRISSCNSVSEFISFIYLHEYFFIYLRYLSHKRSDRFRFIFRYQRSDKYK